MDHDTLLLNGDFQIINVKFHAQKNTSFYASLESVFRADTEIIYWEILFMVWVCNTSRKVFVFIMITISDG